MIYVKRYQTENGQIIAMCDEELLGKVFREAKLELDLDRYAGFYKGELVESKKAKEMITPEDLYTANVVGKDSVKIFLSEGMVSKSDVKKVSGIPFVHIYKMV